MSIRLEIDVGQFMLDTMAFPPDVLGAYVRLLVAYRANGPLNIYHLERISGLDTWSDGRVEDQIGALFQERDGFWHNATLDAQIEKTGRLRKNALKASAVAAAGSKPATVVTEVFKGPLPGEARLVEEAPMMPIDSDSRMIGEKVQTHEVFIGMPKPNETDEIGTPLPQDWSLAAELLVGHRGEGYALGDIADAIDSFKRYHLVAGTLSPDWNASWLRWWERKKPEKPKAKPRVQVSRKAEPDAAGS